MRSTTSSEVEIRTGGRTLSARLIWSWEAADLEIGQSILPPSWTHEYDPRLYFAWIDQMNWIPRIVAIRENSRLLGLVYARERKVLGLKTGLMLLDGSLLRAVVSSPADHQDVLCAAIQFLFSCLGVRGLRLLIPPEGVDMEAVCKSQANLPGLEVQTFPTRTSPHLHLSLPTSYHEFLCRLGSDARRNFRRYRKHFEAGGGQFCAQMGFDDFAEATAYLGSKCHARDRAGARSDQRFLKMLAVTKQPLLAGLRSFAGVWLAVLGGWHSPQRTTLVLQLNNDSDYPHASLSTVLRSYLIEMLISRGIRDLFFWKGSSAPLEQLCTIMPTVTVHLDARTAFWRFIRSAAPRIAASLPPAKDAADWVARRAS